MLSTFQDVASVLSRQGQPRLAGTAVLGSAPFQRRQAHGGVDAPAVLDSCHAGAGAQVRHNEAHLALRLAQQPGSLHPQVAACSHNSTAYSKARGSVTLHEVLRG